MIGTTAPEGVSPTYVHYEKSVRPGAALTLGGTTLKWYDIAKDGMDVTRATADLARAFIVRESEAGALGALGDLGFVILHRCGESFHFLLVSTWRGNNELWESVYAMDGPSQTDFAHYDHPAPHRGTFCVWELQVVMHEQQAWRAYLLSERGTADRETYLADLYAGPA